MSKAKAPSDLGQSGKSLWDSLVNKYEFRPDEIVVVTRIARALDRLDAMAESLGDKIMSTGSTGAPVVHPLIAEIRAHEALVASLFKQLNLPDEDSAAGESSRSTQARKAAQSRWAVAHGAAS